MSIYSAYAPIYAAIGQGDFARALAGRILAGAPAPRRVLDLACGAGAAALAFAEAGAAVVGVDRAPAMLEQARLAAAARGHALTLIQADLRHLGAQPALAAAGPFDLAVCLYNSLNYLLEPDDLAMAFAGIAPLLAPGGRLIFDLNAPAEYAVWDDTFQVLADNDAYLVYSQLSYDSARGRARGRIVWFVRELERWWRGEELHEQRLWADAEVRAALAAAGLRLVAADDLAGGPLSADTRQAVYTAERPL